LRFFFDTPEKSGFLRGLLRVDYSPPILTNNTIPNHQNNYTHTYRSKESNHDWAYIFSIYQET